MVLVLYDNEWFLHSENQNHKAALQLQVEMVIETSV